MAEDEKPYRVYRARRGRKKTPPPQRGNLLGGDKPGAPGALGEPGSGTYRGPGALPKPAHWGRRIGIGVAVLFIVLVAWGVFGWLSFSSGVSDANSRLGPEAKQALTPQSG